jgi:geranylgeranyl diphosphate synthase type II
MLSVKKYQEEFIEYLVQYSTVKEPQGLYTPIQYILNLGGKRLRPILTLMTADIFNGDYKKALNAALSIEIFHNFSLVHDDIMDDAPLRRGEKTVHEKWNINTGILAGDAMLIMAYQLFENYEPETFQSLSKIFSKTALEVCEGQQYDVDFETRNDVSIPEYLKMIEYKTAVLVGAAMKMGAIIANASNKDQDGIYEFGRNLGIAFQLQDDYLDAFGDPKTFGKQVGGDIIENKKTFLYLKALEFANTDERDYLLKLYNEKPIDNLYKIEQVKTLFLTTGSAEETQKEIKNYTAKAYSVLDTLNISEAKKELLKTFGDQLMNRTI